MSALISKVLWCCDKLRKRWILSVIENVYKIVLRKLLKELDEIALAAIGVDVVFLEEHVTDLAHRPRRLDEIPDVSANRIQRIVDVAFKVEYRRVSSKIG